MANGELAPVAYRAFLSYSHKDAGAAAKLHRQLEIYKLPKHLIGTTPANFPPVPERLTPIFRDREELSAGSDLSAQVQAALRESQALIVLCSPQAKASTWVGKEIETFRALHPDRPILAAILEGEPDEAFPEALTADGAEPIAADLRKGKDGPRLGRLKLIAGLTGVPLDALVQRDAQRQLRRVTAITAAALAAMLVMAMLLVVALRARSEADRQRAEAEGLVEYMLTDLREKLKGVGRLDVMTAVNERAMRYYGEQASLAGLPPESLDRRARILHAMGEDDEKRGNLDLALAKFKEAHRTTAEVLAQKPNDADAIFAHAQSEYWVGYLAYRKKDRPEAVARFNRYAELAHDIIERDPNGVTGYQELGYAKGNLCTVGLVKGETTKKTVEDCAAALSLMQEVAQRRPDDVSARKDVANRHAWLADAFLETNMIKKAHFHRLAEEKIVQQIRQQNPDDKDALEIWIGNQIETANLEFKLNEPVQARERLARVKSSLDDLTGLDPSNKRWRMLSNRLSLTEQ